MPTNCARRIRVFLAEDNNADAYLIELALKEHAVHFDLRHVTDGQKALEAVDDFGGPEPAPDIALLDVNLPRHDGSTIVQRIREHPSCGRIPIIVMTSSEWQRDRALAATNSAVFFHKPPDLNAFLELGALVKALCQTENSNV